MLSEGRISMRLLALPSSLGVGRSPRGLLLVPLVLLLLGGCSTEAPGDPAPAAGGTGGRPVVITTIEANRYLATRLAGELCEVRMPIPEDADPLHWTPSREGVAALQAASLVVLNGAGLETWLDQVTLAPSRTVTLADAYRGQWLTFDEAVEHQHGPDGDHSHAGVDPHVWFDPQLLKLHVDRMQAALRDLLPEHGDAFAARAAELHADLESLDEAFEAVEGLPPLLANHPAYDYGAHRYDWEILNFDIDPEEVPAPELVEAVAETGRSVLLWESRPIGAVAAAFEARGIRCIVLSACEHPPEEGDWLSVMRENARILGSLGAAPR
jgi:zinc transport system substrate-binding protein